MHTLQQYCRSVRADRPRARRAEDQDDRRRLHGGRRACCGQVREPGAARCVRCGLEMIAAARRIGRPAGSCASASTSARWWPACSASRSTCSTCGATRSTSRPAWKARAAGEDHAEQGRLGPRWPLSAGPKSGTSRSEARGRWKFMILMGLCRSGGQNGHKVRSVEGRTAKARGGGAACHFELHPICGYSEHLLSISMGRRQAACLGLQPCRRKSDFTAGGAGASLAAHTTQPMK